MADMFCLAILLPALCWVVFSDLLYRCIHNRLIMLLLIIWLMLPALSQYGWCTMGMLETDEQWLQFHQTILGAVLVLIVGFMLFHYGLVGAGDVKLVAVLCLWVGGDKQLAFILITSLAGGLLAIMLPLLVKFEQWFAQAWFCIGAHALKLNIPMPVVLGDKRPQGLPYGIAICSAMFYMLFFSATL